MTRAGAGNTALRAFQAAFREHRKAAGLRHEDVARMLGVTRQRVGMLASGKCSPRMDGAEEVAALFGMSLAAFLESGNKTLAQSGEGV